MAEQNEDKIVGLTGHEVDEVEDQYSDNHPNFKGGGNTIGGANAKPMKPGDKESVSQGPGVTKKTIILK